MENVPLQELLTRTFDMAIPDINSLLVFCTDNKCSDLHIKVGERPYISRYGKKYLVPTLPVNMVVWQKWAKEAITSENNAKYVRQKMLDISYEVDSYTISDDFKNLYRGKTQSQSQPKSSKIVLKLNNSDTMNEAQNTSPSPAVCDNGEPEYNDGNYRYRVSCGFSMGHNIAAFRMIANKLPSFSTINYPPEAANLLRQALQNRGKIILFVGATGSGKSTSLIACLNDFTKENGPLCNSTIISLEDPIEYIVPNTDSVNVIQKELGTDFKEFAFGVKQALREHPNYINVGEARDVETINALVEASRTGHGVISSFHASDVGDTLARLYNFLIRDNESIMYDLINNMNIIVCQRLIPSDEGFKLNIQWLVFTDEVVKFLIRNVEEGKNIPTVVGQLFADPKFKGIAKDWSM